MTADDGAWARLRSNLVWLSGAAWFTHWRGKGVPAILNFERVRPARRGGFQPLASQDITPDKFDRLIGALQRWRIEIVSMDGFCERLRRPAVGKPFVCLTLNGAWRDVVDHAYPVLVRRRVPFSVYVPTAFPDGLSEPWEFALEAVIARHDRISLVIDRTERHYEAAETAAKQQLFNLIAKSLLSQPPAARSGAINDLCRRYDVDLRAVARDLAIGWDDIAKLAADERATIGSSTVNYTALTDLGAAAARREIAMGKSVLETALRREVRHFAYPYGDRASFGAQHVAMAEEAGFRSAVSTIPATISDRGNSNVHALPRLTWHKDQAALRTLRVKLCGY